MQASHPETYSPIIPPWHVIILYDLWRLLELLTQVELKYDMTVASHEAEQRRGDLQQPQHLFYFIFSERHVTFMAPM